MPLSQLHHVTAITGNAPENLRFYTQTLGMRLVKRTVNQDDVSAYHLFYADGKGTPGTDLTFFDWPYTPSHHSGVPDIGPIALRISRSESIGWWQERFAALAVTHAEPILEDGLVRLPFEDPEGQRLELVAAAGEAPGSPWLESPVPEEHQVLGLHGLTLTSVHPEATSQLLVAVFSLEVAAERQLEAGRLFSFRAAGGGGSELRLLVPREPTRSGQGKGGVHHLALRVSDDAAQEEWRQRLLAVGLRPTPVIDRFYFKSVYFREPGGNLFEIATDGPGFTADEPLTGLGDHLALPPFLEPQRAEIEAGLVPLAI